MVQLHRPTGQFMVRLRRKKYSQGRGSLRQADCKANQHEEKRQDKRGKSFLHTGNIHSVTVDDANTRNS